MMIAGCFGSVCAAQIEHWQTENGARVFFLAAPEVPMVDVRIVFDAGSARDGNHPGVAALTNALLIEGADGLSGEQLRDRVADLGAQYRHSVDRDKAWVGARLLSDEDSRQRLTTVLSTLLAKPDFLPEVFVREQTRQLQAIRERSQSLRNVAQDAFYATAYEGHPYATPALGTQTTLTAVTRVDVELFHARYYTARNAVIAIIGDLTQSDARDMAAGVSKDLPAGEPTAALPPAVSTLARQRATVKQSAQTHVWLGLPVMSYGDPDYFALYVGNHMLGGAGLVSRLFKVIREERGLAYSAYSFFAPLRAAGPFVAGLQTRNDQLGGALELLRATIGDFVRKGPDPEELESAKQNIVSGFPLRVDSNGKKLEQLVTIGFFGLPLDYLETFSARVEKVTQEQVRDAFKRRVRLEQMVLVTVGSAAVSE